MCDSFLHQGSTAKMVNTLVRVTSSGYQHLGLMYQMKRLQIGAPRANRDTTEFYNESEIQWNEETSRKS